MNRLGFQVEKDWLCSLASQTCVERHRGCRHRSRPGGKLVDPDETVRFRERNEPEFAGYRFPYTLLRHSARTGCRLLFGG